MDRGQGQYVDNSQYGGRPNPYGYQGMYPNMYPDIGPTFQPVTLPSQSFAGAPPAIKIGLELKDGQAADYLNKQFGLQIGGMALNTFKLALDYGLATQAMGSQEKIALEYYKTKREESADARAVAMREVDLREEAIFAQERMHSKQTDHELLLKKLEGKTQERLAMISERGKNERARLFSVTDAFSARRDWDYGFGLS